MPVNGYFKNFLLRYMISHESITERSCECVQLGDIYQSFFSLKNRRNNPGFQWLPSIFMPLTLPPSVVLSVRYLCNFWWKLDLSLAKVVRSVYAVLYK